MENGNDMKNVRSSKNEKCEGYEECEDSSHFSYPC